MNITEFPLSWNGNSTDSNSAEGSNNGSVVFPDVPIFTTASHATIGFVGISGNLCVIVVLFSNKKLRRKLINIYILNQVSSRLLKRVSFHNVVNFEHLFCCSVFDQG